MVLGAITVAWPGVVFTPPIGGLWYKPALLPGTVDYGLGVSADTHPKGNYQVSIFFPPGAGTSALFAAADAVVANFDRVRLGSLQCGVPKIGPLLQEPDWLHLPVTIPYLST